MPIRRLFGLLVSVLCLLSAPALAQTVAFIDGSGADAAETASYAERSRVYVRVVDPAADLSPGGLDSVSVALATAVSLDWESLTLTETDVDSGVFEGSIPLGQSATPSQPDVLETAVDPGPPVARDTLTVEYGAATDTAAMVGARVQLLDGHGRPAAGFTQDDWIHIRVEEHRYMNPPEVRDLLTVAVDAPGSGDEELVSVRETSSLSGIFEGRLQAALFATADGNGVVGDAAGGVVRARFEVYDVPETLEVQVALVGSRAEILDPAGEPADHVMESSTLRLQVIDKGVGSPWAVDTVQVEITCQISVDEETVTLVETGPDTGVFEAGLPTAYGGGWSGDGVLNTSQLEGPPHQFDTIHLAYAGAQGGASDSVTTYGSETRFTDAWGNEVAAFAIGSTAWVRVVDQNVGSPSQVDDAYVHLESLTTGESETIVLRETGIDTSTYVGSIELVDHPTGPLDLELRVQDGEEVRVMHADLSGYSASADRARVRLYTLAFVDEQGRPTGELLESGTARVRLLSAAANPSPYDPDTASVLLESREGGDQEVLQLTETGADTGEFTGEIPMDFVYPGSAYQPGRLETSNTWGPDPAPDVVTASAGDAVVRAVTVGARVQLVDAVGQDADVFAAGQQVGVRVTDYNIDQPYTRQTLPVQVYADPETGDQEEVLALETGVATGVFEGFVQTRSSAGSTVANGVLEVRPGGRIEARHSHDNDPRVAVDAAIVATSDVQFVDADGRSASVYMEATEAHVLLVWADGNVSPSAADTAAVIITTRIASDSETLTLTETGPDSGVFRGSIPLSLGSTVAGNGLLETSRTVSPPDQDTLTVAHATARDTATTVGSRTWFLDAWGNPVEAYAQGTVAYVRVEDHGADTTNGYDTLTVDVRSLAPGDQEILTLQETGPSSGIFEGSIPLVSSPFVGNDGVLRVMPGEEIEAVDLVSYSSARAVIRYATATFIDEAGAPTGEVLESGVARLRVVGSSPAGSTIGVAVQSLYGGDLESVTLTETSPGSQVYEGTVQLSFVPRGSGITGNGVLDTSNSGAPDYLGDELTVIYQDAEATVVTIPSRVQLLDSYGRVASTFAVGERVGVRVEDHGYDDPLVRGQMDAQVEVVGYGDTQTVYLTETGYDTNVYEGTFDTEDAPVVSNDGVLQVQAGREIEARHPNRNAPESSVARAVMSGASVLFVDAQGQPADVYFERTAAYVRVTDSFTSGTVTVTLQSTLGLDSEALTLTETGPSTGVFEGSIPLTMNGASPDNGYLETGQDSGPVHRFDTLVASYGSVTGTVSDTVGMIGSRTWFVDAWGNDAESYTAGTRAYLRVEDHVGNAMPGYTDSVQVTLYAPETGDSETVTLRETPRDSGIFTGSLPLEKEDYPPSPSPNDGILQSMPGEEIEAVHSDDYGGGSSSDRAVIRYATATFIDEAGAPTREVLESGVARLRVVGSSPGSTIGVAVQSLYGGDLESVTLAETSPGSQVYEGTVQLSFVPPGGGVSGNGVLDASNSGAPDYLGDELTVIYQDAEGTAVTIPSRVQLLDSYGRVASAFAVGERVGVRVEDHGYDDPLVRGQVDAHVEVVGYGDTQTVYLTETGYDTNVYEGSFGTEDAPAVSNDGLLQVQVGRVIEARHPNRNAADSSVAQAVMSGASVLFVDAQGQPAEVYFERTFAYVRVSDSFASGTVTVTLQSTFGLDSEALTLTETGPSTGVFEGSIPLIMNGASPNDGFLSTGQDYGPPHELDTLVASYGSVAGTVSDTVGMTGSRTWFVDAWGNDAESYTAGTRAYLRVEDHIGNAMPGYTDQVQVTLFAPDTGDSETVTLRETPRDSGIFTGSLPLEKEDYPPSPSPNDGILQSMPGEEIEVVHADYYGGGSSSDRAVIRYATATFIDEAGAPTREVLESGVARLRVVGSSPGSTIGVAVQSLYGEDLESVTLAETSPGSQVYEGTVQLSFVPRGSGITGNGVLDASNSGAPDYLGDELTVIYQDAEATAVTIPSRVQLLDSYGRVASTFAVGERVGVRVEDHGYDDPLVRGQVDAQVEVVGYGDTQTVYLTETGYDTNIYEGTFGTEDAPAVSNDGVLQVQVGRVIEARHPNRNASDSSVAQAVMSGASVLFVDAQGQPAEVYFERTFAYVRVSDSFASGTVTVTLQSTFGLDSEALTLTETGPSTGVFEGSIPLIMNGASPNDGFLSTGQDSGPPHELDTLVASYGSVAGTVSDTVGMTGSRTWFVDAWGNETESYTAGTTAYVRVEDHIGNAMPDYTDQVQVTLFAPDTGDSETVTLLETPRDSGIFAGSLPLEKEDYPPARSPNDGRLQSMAGEEIEVVHADDYGGGSSSDRAVIRYATATFIDEAGAPTGEVLESGVARLRVVGSSPGSTIGVAVQSLYGGDQESVSLTETSPGSQVYEGAVQLSFVSEGGGVAGNGVLDASNSGAPDYLGDELTVIYQDAEATAVTIPSRVQLLDSYGRVASTFAVGERVGVRVEDHGYDDPLVRGQMDAQVEAVGSADVQTVYLTETGYDTNVYEGTFETEDATVAYEDGMLQVQAGQVIEARHPNRNSPDSTRARAVMSGASVLFADEQGRPAEAYFERTRAYVRVTDSFAAGVITATVRSTLGLDSELLTLNETGASTGVFEGSIGLGTSGAVQNDGILETGRRYGPPLELDTLVVTYTSGTGTVTGTAGMIGSRTWFIDGYGNEADSYAAGSMARVRVRDHNADLPGVNDTVQVTLRSLTTGDLQIATLYQVVGEGLFEESVSLDRTPSPVADDGRLQAMPGEEIEVVYTGAGGVTSSDRAVIRYSQVLILDPTVDGEGEVLEKGQAYIQVIDTTAASEFGVVIRSRYAGDEEIVSLSSLGQGTWRGLIQLSFVPPGGAVPNDGVLGTSNSGAPEYLQDELTVVYQDSEGRAVTVPSRMSFRELTEFLEVTEYAAGSMVRVWIRDFNANLDPGQVDTTTVTLAGTGDSETVTLTEMGEDFGLFEVWVPGSNAAGVPGDGILTTAPRSLVTASHPNVNTPVSTTAQAGITGNFAPRAMDDAVETVQQPVTFAPLANDVDPDGEPLDVAWLTYDGSGSVSWNPDDTLTYTPAPDFVGTETFTYVASDPRGGMNRATVTVTVTRANHAPVAFDDLAGVDEDGAPIAIDVLANDTDADGDLLQVTSVGQPTSGTSALQPDGTILYTPAPDAYGEFSFSYQVSDPSGAFADGLVTVIVNPVNDPPVAGDDPATVVEDGSVTVTVLGNDTDVENDTLAVDSVTQGASGAVTTDGLAVTYTPNASFHGTDAFTYTVRDFGGGTDTATVAVTVTPVADPPVAVDDSASTDEDTAVTVAVLANDTDADNDALDVVYTTGVTNGIAVVNADETVTFTPAAGFHGTATFDYSVSDGADTDLGTVTITVNSVNDLPVAADDTAFADEDSSVTVLVLANDTDADDDTLTVSAVTQGANGTVTLDPVTYTPAADFHGTDSFTYTVSDGNGGTDTATVTVTVAPSNDAPAANDDAASVVEDGSVIVNVLGNDNDADIDTLTVTAVTQGTNGAVTLDPVTYTPNADFHGTDSFTYTVSDGNGGTDTATVTVTVTPVNDAPAAGDDTASVVEDGSVSISVLGNDADVENDTLTVTAVTQGGNGSVTLNPVTYTPNANYNGADSFTYTISDGNGGTDTATVNVTVGSANDAPVANDDAATVAEDGSVSISVLANDTDLDDDTLTVTAVTQGANGTVTLNPVTYTPAPNFFGTDSFTYTISDGNGGTDTATVTVTVAAVNDAPAAVDDSAATLAEMPVAIQVRNNDTDVDSAMLTITAVTQGAHGTVAIDAGQTVTYTPAAAWIGPDTFTYTISDGAGGTATATVNVEVQAPPRVSADIQVLYAFDEGSGTTVSDTSGVGAPLNLTVANASAVTWQPGALSIDSATLVESAGDATKVINACKASNEVTVEAWVLPANLTQTGPAAIVTIGQNHTKRDVTLGQSGSAYNGQLRTSTTGQAGTQLNASGVASLNLTHVVYTRSSTGAVRIYVDGAQAASGTLTGNLSTWASFNLALGGELSGTRYWAGDLHLVAIYSRALTATEVRQNWLAGAD